MRVLAYLRSSATSTVADPTNPSTVTEIVACPGRTAVKIPSPAGITTDELEVLQSDELPIFSGADVWFE